DRPVAPAPPRRVARPRDGGRVAPLRGGDGGRGARGGGRGAGRAA
ncbi:MAG: hypothetical protein AVDCRST_MAG11-3779, partial [uncultured Gemmatimonadaceae bacterium]